MMEVIGTHHALHPIIKSRIAEPNQTKMQNLYKSRTLRLPIHCPRCPLSGTFMGLLEKATFSDANKRWPVRELLKQHAIPQHFSIRIGR